MLGCLRSRRLFDDSSTTPRDGADGHLPGSGEGIRQSDSVSRCSFVRRSRGGVEEKFPKENFRVNREMRDEILVKDLFLSKFCAKMASKCRENGVKIWILGFRCSGLGFSEVGFRV